MNDLTPARLRELKREATIRPFDLAEQPGLPEAALVVGIGSDALTGPPGGRIIKIFAVRCDFIPLVISA